MKNTIITTGADARKGLISGINKLNDLVSSTLGPNGNNVVIQTAKGPIVSKDGVTVASLVHLPDNAEQLGVSLIQQVSKQTAEKAGDGTTTSTLLATEMINAGFKNIVAGANANVIKSGMEYARKVYIDILKSKFSMPITDESRLTSVATISANNDEVLGTLISDAIKTVGVNGAINITESNTAETYVENVEGLRIENRGYISPYMVTNEGRQAAELNEPLVFMTMGTLSYNTEIEKILTLAFTAKKPLFIISEGINGEALQTIVTNKMKGLVITAAIKAPMFGEYQMKYMLDIAALTGAKVLQTPEYNKAAKDVELSDLGVAGKVIVNENETTIIEGGGDTDVLNERIAILESELANTDSINGHLVDMLQERISKLCGGVVRIHIGAYTEAELKEKKDRLEDSLHATRAALEEGIVAGGGVTNLMIQKELKLVDIDDKTDDFKTGFNIVVNALDKPITKILSNSVTEDVSEIVWNIKHSEIPNWGYNALTKEYGDLIELGVIDPTRVLRVSISTAVSLAATVLTTNGTVCYESEEGRTIVNF